jgi:hypothetical protein
MTPKKKAEDLTNKFLDDCDNYALCKHYGLITVNEILKVYWGWNIPELKDYLEEIKKLDTQLYNFWYTYKDNYSRNAFLGSQFRLYAEMLTLGIDCNEEYFDLQENIDSIRLHKEMWGDFCEKIGIDNVFN